MIDTELLLRKQLTQAKRIVVKAGTHVLVDKNGRPNKRRIGQIVNELSELRHQGYEVIFVSSGAIGAGIQAMGFSKRPNNIPDLQMAASIGQTRLIALYHELFAAKKINISQVLLTHDDLRHRQRHLNARNTMNNLLRNNILPIVNENDVVAVDEIKVGDNDLLSAMVSILINADALILLTTPDGLRQNTESGKSVRIKYLAKVDQKARQLVFGKQQSLSTGGMGSKLESAQLAAKIGSLVVIASGKQTGVLNKIMAGEDVGTLIGHPDLIDPNTKKRKQWISIFHKAQGDVIIDQGAQIALQHQSKSLLPVGIKSIAGTFPMGAMVNIKNHKQEIIGYGLVEYSSHDIEKIKGKHTSEISKILGSKDYLEIIHRDNMVIQ